MEAPYIDGNRVVLSKTYKQGSREIAELVFGEVTAKEMAMIPMGENLKFGEYYPIICALCGITPGVLNQLVRDDIMKAVEHTAFLLAS